MIDEGVLRSSHAGSPSVWVSASSLLALCYCLFLFAFGCSYAVVSAFMELVVEPIDCQLIIQERPDACESPLAKAYGLFAVGSSALSASAGRAIYNSTFTATTAQFLPLFVLLTSTYGRIGKFYPLWKLFGMYTTNVVLTALSNFWGYSTRTRWPYYIAYVTPVLLTFIYSSFYVTYLLRYKANQEKITSTRIGASASPTTDVCRSKVNNGVRRVEVKDHVQEKAQRTKGASHQTQQQEGREKGPLGTASVEGTYRVLHTGAGMSSPDPLALPLGSRWDRVKLAAWVAFPVVCAVVSVEIIAKVILPMQLLLWQGQYSTIFKICFSTLAIPAVVFVFQNLFRYETYQLHFTGHFNFGEVDKNWFPHVFVFNFAISGCQQVVNFGDLPYVLSVCLSSGAVSLASILSIGLRDALIGIRISRTTRRLLAAYQRSSRRPSASATQVTAIESLPPHDGDPILSGEVMRDPPRSAQEQFSQPAVSHSSVPSQLRLIEHDVLQTDGHNDHCQTTSSGRDDEGDQKQQQHPRKSKRNRRRSVLDQSGSERSDAVKTSRSVYLYTSFSMAFTAFGGIGFSSGIHTKAYEIQMGYLDHSLGYQARFRAALTYAAEPIAVQLCVATLQVLLLLVLVHRVIGIDLLTWWYVTPKRYFLPAIFGLLLVGSPYLCPHALFYATARDRFDFNSIADKHALVNIIGAT